RRGGDGSAAGAPSRRHHDLHGDPRPALRALCAALGAPVRRSRGGRPGGPLMDTLWRDLKVGWRSLWRTPAFAFVVVLILGLGIGANTMIFNIMNAFLFRSWPYMDFQRNALIYVV